MKVNYKFFSLLNFLLFLVCVTILLLPHFVDKDVHRILLSKLTLFLFYPFFIVCSILSFIGIINRKKLKILYQFLNYMVLLFLIIFFCNAIYVVFFKEV
jgi:hypothetical protein